MQDSSCFTIPPMDIGEQAYINCRQKTIRVSAYGSFSGGEKNNAVF